MRKLFFLLTLFVCAGAVADDAIRSFPIPTLQALGKDLYQRDTMAAAASDLLFATHPQAQELPMRGRITQNDEDHHRVYFIQEKDSQSSLAYVVSFPEHGEPKTEDQRGMALPDFVAKRFAARQTAIKAIPKFMTEHYNFEVLDDPDGKGFLVYGLAASSEPNEVVAGGHYRVMVSADGREAKQVDALSKSFLVLKKSDVPKGSATAGLVMSHVVSATPIETHVYLSLLHKLPLFVTTPGHDIWKVSDGEITKMTKE